MWDAFLVGLVVFLCVGGHELIGFSLLFRPIVVGPFLGLLMGDLQTGLKIGAALETIFMGVINIGGASAAEPGLATALATGFAIKLGGGVDAAIALALPIGILGQQIKLAIYILFSGSMAPVFDRLAAEGKQKQFTYLHFGVWGIWFFAYSLIPFFAMLFGANAVQAALNMIPEVIMNGLSIAGNLLPAVGMAMLLRMLWENKIAVFFFLGFVLVAYLKLPLVAVAVIAFIVAILMAQRDYQLNKLEKAKPAVVTQAASNVDQEEEDFFA
ncbi:PTS sugar transporter subunit IIC [Enterococcus hulanensis]|uniref:PTS mannose/fructose/sorbose/N-acetylgalactosamine transporter subunit IIC n=1 Tax=Enterococcus hulanensis TaxID=2559929 RepID=UPI001A8F5D89|nr:PTS sugar transporter subunit IIC [Enterococcus hulanensis]MBO0459767.1 PTS sugar transporter subunit IIC [Enterococcus hulanensis]